MNVERIGDWTLEERLNFGDRPLVVMFLKSGGARNAPLRAEFRYVAEEHPHARFYEVDLLENPSLVAQYALADPPLVLIFVEGVEAARHVGTLIATTVDRILGPCPRDGEA